MNKQLSVASPRQAAKRGPTTPLKQSNIHNKRKVVSKPEPIVKTTLAPDSPSASLYRAEILEAKYQNWCLEQNLARQKSLVSFLELELRLHQDSLS